MSRTVGLYALLMGAGAFALQWLEYQYTVKVFSTELYVVLIAIGFTVIGVWLGNRLTAKPKQPFERNHRALDALGVSDREYQVLELLAAGHTNRQIAERLFVSTNTVKTHLSNLYRKLDVSRRTEAINKARELRLIG